MRTVLIGIARMGSSRLPGKVLMDLGGKPVIEWIVDTAHNASLVDDVIIATTTDPRDDAIADWCKENGVKCFRGSEDDVLSRFVGAAEYMNADVAVRVTCDCPFLDPNVIDQVIALRKATSADYASNIDPPTWPDGLDVEAIAIDALKAAHNETTSKIDRECVTCWITRNRYRFKCETLICPLPGMHKERWVLDAVDDLELCRMIASKAKSFGWLSIKQCLDKYHEEWQMDLRQLNSDHPRNERYFAALAEEPIVPRSYTNSQKLLRRAKDVIPLGTQTFSKSEIQYPADSPLFVTHGDGGYCFDADGNRFVDLVGGLLPVILGHRDPDVDYAVRGQMNRGVCFSLATELEAQLAETLCRLIPCAEWARFGKNGTDVTSAAVRLARAHTGRDYILSSGYHGWADWAVANDALRNKGVPQNHCVLSLKNDLHEFDEFWVGPSWIEDSRGKDDIAAVIIEPETNPEFLKKCRKFCDKTGALLIFDEIITGFRFDLGGAQKLYGVTPDIACFGKSMANGYPISCIVGKKEYYDTMAKICFSGTFFGDPIALTAAIATIEKMEREDVLPKIHLMSDKLRMEVELWHRQEFANDYGFHFAGSQLTRLNFKDNDIKTLFIQEMAQAGVLIIASHNLMYAHGPDEIRRVVRAYEHTLPILADAIKKNDVKERIKGRSIPAYANVRL